MESQAAHDLALSLMEQHGLIAQGWRFRWSLGKRQLGSAHVMRPRRGPEIRTIRLSRHLVRLNDEPEVRDTILHEIAHALVGIEHGHDGVWKAKCIEIGASPRRLAGDDVNVIEARWVIVCDACRRTVARRHRRVNPRRLQRCHCRDCGPAAVGRLRQHDAALVQARVGLVAR